MTNIFADLHHSALYLSLQYLFVDRSEYHLFRPIGEDWFTNGYWKLAEPYNNHPDTIKQYLGIRDAKYDPYTNLNEIERKEKGYYIINFYPKNHRAVTFEQFKNINFDIIIASHPSHVPVYADLIRKFQPKAKLIHQQGNEWPVDFSIVKNLLSSTLPYKVPNGVNTVFYHQEFNTDLYRYENPNDNMTIRSFIHCLSSQDMFKNDWNDFINLEKELPSYKFEAFGASCRDGSVDHQQEVAEKMQQSSFAFHLKTGGDGYGHVLHSWACVGRPIIYRGSQYNNKLGGLLLKHLETGIDLDQMSIKDTAEYIQTLDCGKYLEMCTNTHNLFVKTVDFDKEHEQIRKFLSNLI